MYKFQFQSGAVKRQFETNMKLVKENFNSKVVRLKVEKAQNAANAAFYFNSKVVRLKVSKGLVLCGNLWDFNSKVVRLKVCNKSTGLFSTTKFQFQSGAVKSMVTVPSSALLANFNSKVVRLKANSLILAMLSLFYFNSKVVRLKG